MEPLQVKETQIIALEKELEVRQPAKAVLFVQYTKNSELAGQIKEMIESLRPWTRIGMKPKVKEFVRQFEFNVTVRNTDKNVEAKADKKGVVKDAFEALMCRNERSDTHSKKTPVRKRVKCLESITSKNEIILNWVSKK